MSAQKLKKKKAKTGEKKSKMKFAEKTVFAPSKSEEEVVVVLPGKLNICVIGVGAIGGLVAAYLRNTRRRVYVVGKPEQMRAIRMHGLRVEGVKGTALLEIPIKEEMDEKVDLVILAVKTQDVSGVIDRYREFLSDTLILTIQNGVHADKIIARTLGEKNIISSIVMFGATYLKPGLITHNFEGDWILGRPFGANDEKVKEVAEELSPAFKMVVSDNITGMKWTKLFLNANNCIPALLGKSMQETFTNLEMAKLSILLLKECFSIVDDSGIELVNLPSFEVEKFRGLVKMPLDEAAKIFSGIMTNLSKEPLYGSILQSIKRGRVSEIDYINGEFVTLSRFGRVGAVLNMNLVNLVHEVEKKKRFFTIDEIKQKCRITETHNVGET